MTLEALETQFKNLLEAQVRAGAVYDYAIVSVNNGIDIAFKASEESEFYYYRVTP
jgi:hypothetical protein